MPNSSKKEKKEKSPEVLMLAERFKELRKKAGYSSYEKFANQHELVRTQVGRYEQGENIRFDSLVRMCKALDITLAEFFSEGFD